MDQNIEMLNYIYQNSDMGIISINQILKNIDDKEFKEILKEQLDDYNSIAKSSKELLREKGREEKDINMMNKIESYVSIKMSTMKDNTSSHLAEMMIKGSNMGIIDITKNLNKYNNIESSTKKLARNLLNIEEKNIEKLKPYL